MADTPAVTPPDTVGALPWYKSQVQVAQIVALITAFATLFPKNQLIAALGLDNPDAVTTLINQIGGFITFVSAAYGAAVRAKSHIQPLTVTQAAADSHPSTLAAARVQQLSSTAGVPTTGEVLAANAALRSINK